MWLIAGAFVVSGSVIPAGGVPLPARLTAANCAATGNPWEDVGTWSAQHPPMGWNSYYSIGPAINASQILAQAEGLCYDGLFAKGFRLIQFDTGWWWGARYTAAEIGASPRLQAEGFQAGDMKLNTWEWDCHGVLSDRPADPWIGAAGCSASTQDLTWLISLLHQHGFFVGAYTDAGAYGCGGANLGSYGHYGRDANRLAAWGFDALKVDFCGGINIRQCTDGTCSRCPSGCAQAMGSARPMRPLNPRLVYRQFYNRVRSNGIKNDMLFFVCDFVTATNVQSLWGSGRYRLASFSPAITHPAYHGDPMPAGTYSRKAYRYSSWYAYHWAHHYANAWRTDTDIAEYSGHSASFADITRNLLADARHPKSGHTGHWSDPDVLLPHQDWPGISDQEFRTQASMWAVVAAPYLLGFDATHAMSGNMWPTLSNYWLLQVEQDLSRQGREAWSSGSRSVWVRRLQSGWAVAFLNTGATAQTVSTSFGSLGIPGAGAYKVVHVWTAGGDHGSWAPTQSSSSLSATVAGHGVELFVVFPQ